MDLTTRAAVPTDIAALVALAEEAQQSPTRHITYLASDADAIEVEMMGLDGWPDNCTVAVRGGEPVGWLQGESDVEIGRVWWWGPFVAPGEALDTALRLYDAAVPKLDPAITQEELGPDDRNDIVVALADARGFRGETASMVLSRTPEPGTAPDVVRPYEAADAATVAALHERLFPGTHTTGAGLVDPAASRHLLVAEAGTVVGYIAFEVQADGSGYIDFVAVDPDRRGTGIGAALVTAACSELDDLDVTRVHLTVRENNAAARAVYAKLGFVEERVIRPYRKGFSLDA